MSLVTEFLREQDGYFSEVSDDVLQEFANDVFPDLVRAEKGIGLRREAASQMKKTEQARLTSDIWETGEKVDRALLGSFGWVFGKVNENLREVQAPVSEGIQRGSEVITGSENETYRSISSMEAAAEMMLEPDNSATAGLKRNAIIQGMLAGGSLSSPAVASASTIPVAAPEVTRAAFNTGVGLLGATISPAGIATLPLAYTSPIAAMTVRAGMVGEGALAAERAIDAAMTGDTYGAVAGGLETALFTAGGATSPKLRQAPKTGAALEQVMSELSVKPKVEPSAKPETPVTPEPKPEPAGPARFAPEDYRSITLEEARAPFEKKPGVEVVETEARYNELARQHGIPNAVQDRPSPTGPSRGVNFVDDATGKVVAFAPESVIPKPQGPGPASIASAKTAVGIAEKALAKARESAKKAGIEWVFDLDPINNPTDYGARTRYLKGPKQRALSDYEFAKSELAKKQESLAKVEAAYKERTQAVKQTEPSPQANRYKIGKSPQPWIEVERMKQSPIEAEMGEFPIKVRNEKTGEEAIVLESQLTAIKAKKTKQPLKAVGAATPEDIARVTESMKPRKFMERFIATEEIQLETRQGVRNEFYAPRSHAEVNVAVNTMIENGGVETMMRRLLQDDPTLPPDHKVAAQLNILKRLNQQAIDLDASGETAKANHVRDQQISFLDSLVDRNSTEYGRGVSAHRMWNSLTPEGVLRDYIRSVAKINEKSITKITDGIKGVGSIIQSDAFKQADVPTQRGMLIDAFKGLGRASKSLRQRVSVLLDAAKDPKLFDEAMMREITDALKLPKVDEAFAREILKAAQDAQKLPEGFQRDFAMSKVAGKLRDKLGISGYEIGKAWWYASILSGPPTQIVNIGAGALKVVTDLGIMTGLHPKAAGNIWKGAIEGIKEGWAEAKAIVREGDYSRRERNLFEPQTLEILSESPNRFKRFLSYGKYVGRLMTAADMVNFKAAEEGFARLQAYKSAKTEKLTGKELQARVDEILYDRVDDVTASREQAIAEGASGNNLIRRIDEIIEHKRDAKMMDQARQFALEATYNNDPVGGIGKVVEVLNQLKAAPGPVGVFATAVTPFVRIVGNVFSEGLNWTPYGYRRMWRAFREGMPPDAVSTYHTKAAAGTFGFFGLYFLIHALQKEGEKEPWFDVYGPGPEDRDGRNAMREIGWKPNTVKLGDKYISYLNTPFFMPFAMLGYMRDAEKYKDMSRKDLLDRTAFTFAYAARSIFDQSFLTGVTDFVESLSSQADGRQLVGILQRTGSGLVIPSFVKWMDRVWDPTITSGDTLRERFLRDIPVARSAFGKPMLNALGDPVVREGSARFSMDRFWTERDDDQLWNLFYTKNVYPHKPSKSILINNEPITAEQYYELTRIRGQELKRVLMMESNLKRLSEMEPEAFKEYLINESRRATQNAKDLISSQANR